MGYSPWSCKESDMNKQLTLSLSNSKTKRRSKVQKKRISILFSNLKNFFFFPKEAENFKCIEEMQREKSQLDSHLLTAIINKSLLCGRMCTQRHRDVFHFMYWKHSFLFNITIYYTILQNKTNVNKVNKCFSTP